MNDIVQATNEFVKYIKDSETYKKYMTENNKMKNYPELKKRVDEYRRNLYILQNTEDGDKLYDEVDKIEAEGESLRAIPLVNDFLGAELAFCRMMQNIYRQITAEVDFDMTLGG